MFERLARYGRRWKGYIAGFMRVVSICFQSKVILLMDHLGGLIAFVVDRVNTSWGLVPFQGPYIHEDTH